MKKFLLRYLTWWSGSTPGTDLWTWRFGEFVGADGFGNRYYRTIGGKKDPALGYDRRWVTYAGEADASAVPPGWAGWLHGQHDVPPSQDGYVPHEWERAHMPNMTGTPLAYRPKGSVLSPTERAKGTGDYEAWTPGA